MFYSGLPALFDEKSGNPKLIRRALPPSHRRLMEVWGRPSCRKQGCLGAPQPQEAKESGGRSSSACQFSEFFNENKAFLGLTFCFIKIL